jgi:N-methylhydantoinase B
VRAITAPGARSNDGFFAPFSLTIPPGTVFSAEPPAPTGWYYEGAAFANDLFWKALAPACPDRLGAGSYTSLCCSYVVGRDSATDELFVLAEPNVGGWGGSAVGDGESALIATTDGDTYNFPAEVVEARFPVLVERYELNVAAQGGAGRNRGGIGVVREYRLRGGVDTSGYGSVGGSERRPWGLAGGGEGTTNYLEYVRDGAVERRGRVAHVPLDDGQLVRSVTGTGGGFGDPREREPERVRDDVRDGYVTLEYAREVYAVALDPETLEVDAAETAALRSG